MTRSVQDLSHRAKTVLSLRPYQVEKIAEARALMTQGKKAICLVSPTGSGKTVICAYIIQSALAKGKRVLFLAHRRELIDQCAAKLRDLGIWDYNVVLSGHPHSRNPDAPVQVASIQTLLRRTFPPADLICVDEAHHAASGSYQTLLKNYPDAYVLGLTATPERLDGKGLDHIFHDLLNVATVPELIDSGFLVAPQCLGPAPEAVASLKAALAEIKVRGGDYAEDQLAEAMDSPTLVGDIVEHWQEWGVGQKTIVFAASIAHSQHIVAQFKAAGIAAAHLDGTLSLPEREGVLSAWRGTGLDVVSNCQILTEGFDFPELSCCILARPTKSVALYLQMVGRVLRTAPGKQGAVILDHAGNIMEHGPPQIERAWTLQGSAKKRMAIQTHACFLPGCGAMFVEKDAGAVWWVAATQAGIVENYRFMARKFERMDRKTAEFSKEAKLLICPACSHANCKFCGSPFQPPSANRHDRLVCPHCQGEYSSDRLAPGEDPERKMITAADGSLVLIGEDSPAIHKIKVKNEYNRLLELARQKNHKRGWVWHKLKEQFSEAQLREALPWHKADWWRKGAAEAQGAWA